MGEMRKRFHEDAELNDDEVIAAHDMGEKLALLTKYFEEIMGAQARLDSALEDAT